MARTRGRTPEQIVNLLTGRFPDLAGEPVRSVVLRAVADQLAQPRATFEVILDDPLAANWRLRPHPSRRGTFRVADCRLFGTAPDQEVDRINDLLDGPRST